MGGKRATERVEERKSGRRDRKRKRGSEREAGEIQRPREKEKSTKSDRNVEGKRTKPIALAKFS